jgi:tight adherence protein C
MSEQTYLFVAVLGTFATTALVGVRLVVARQARRAATVLETHLETAGVAVPVNRGEGSFGDRVVRPTASRLSALVSRYTPVGARDQVAHKLTLAGIESGFTAELFLVLRLVSAAAGLALGYYVGVVRGGYLLGPLWVAFIGYVGYLAPGHWLDGKVSARQESIRRDLPDMIDLLTISVEAGLAFDAALLHARRAMPGALSDEVGRLLHEMQLGSSRVDAMRHLGERSNVDELKSFVLAMVQADIFGVSVANVLRGQSQELRTKRKQRSEEKAMKTPVKLLFPMICCIMPALLVVIVGPGIIRISHMFGSAP